MNRDPSRTVLYKVVTGHLETFLASLDAAPDAKGLPAYVQREFYDHVQCGILAHGFLRLGCDTCQKELLRPCSGKRRGFCPSWAGWCMTLTAAHLVECVGPQGMTRQWVVSVPMPLMPWRYWMASSQDLTATVHTIIRYPILSGISSLRSAALCLAPGRVGGAAAARWAHGRNRGEGGAVGRGWGGASGALAGGGCENAVCIPYPHPPVL
jgi:hypothetical protein